MDETVRLRMRRAHSNHGFFCICGKLVHGNGGHAMHFYVGGQRDAGYREGHREISRSAYLEMHGHPLEHPANAR